MHRFLWGHCAPVTLSSKYVKNDCIEMLKCNKNVKHDNFRCLNMFKRRLILQKFTGGSCGLLNFTFFSHIHKHVSVMMVETTGILCEQQILSGPNTHLPPYHTHTHTTKRAAVIAIAVNGIWAAGLFDIAAMCRLWPSYNSLAPLGNLDPIFSLRLIKPIIPIISLMAGRIKKHTLIIACLHFALFGPVD